MTRLLTTAIALSLGGVAPAFAVDAHHQHALRTYLTAHEALAAEHARTNYWLTHWIDGEITGTRHRLER